MAVRFPPVPKQSSYPKHSNLSSNQPITALLPPPHCSEAMRSLGGASGCCLPHRRCSSLSLSQRTRFRREKVQLRSDPSKTHSKWRQDQCRTEATGQYPMPLNYPPLPFPPTPLIRGAGSPMQQANEGAALPAQLAENRLGRNLRSQ